MKLFPMACGLGLIAIPTLAASQTEIPEVTVTLGTEQTYSVAAMKERCELFQENQQLRPFSIRIECEKTENVWQQISQSMPLPHWVHYEAAGIGKGRIEAESVVEELEASNYECLVHQEKTIFYKGYLDLTCDEFIQNAVDLVSLCRDGYVRGDGVHLQTNWQQVGDLETGKLISDGCATDVQEMLPSEPGQERPVQQVQQQEQQQQRPVQQQQRPEQQATIH